MRQFPDFALAEYARVARALLLYQLGRTSDALLQLEDEEIILRGRPEVHAALAAMIYTGERESMMPSAHASSLGAGIAASHTGALLLLLLLLLLWPCVPEVRWLSLEPGPLPAPAAERPAQRLRAEQQWDIATEFDQRYSDPAWVTANKHWPPKLMAALQRFLALQ